MSAKRSSNSGSSPPQKKMDLSSEMEPHKSSAEPSSSPHYDPSLVSSQTRPIADQEGSISGSDFDPSVLPGMQEISFSQQSISSHGQGGSLSQQEISNFPSQPSISSLPASAPIWPNIDQGFNSDNMTSLPSITDYQEDLVDIQGDNDGEAFASALAAAKEGLGVADTARMILDDCDLKDEITALLHNDTHKQLKESLKHSILTASNKDRRNLLSLTPRVLCEELRDFAPQAYQTLVMGLLSVTDPDTLPDSQHLSNVVAMLYSTISKTINRKASGYGLLMTAVARDGGMREDSMKLLSNLCHPRTAQKYDTEVLGKDWDSNLQNVLETESLRFNELRRAELDLEQISEATPSELENAATNIEQLKSSLPPQIQCVWDNLNLRTRHRFERQRDSFGEFNFDWMASLFIQERISANNMEHQSGCALKEPDELSIEDFVPNQHEKEYMFDGLVHYYSNRLTTRHPLLFK